jgi:hypothetical protein
MSLDIDREITALKRLTVGQLRERYASVFGEGTRVGNKPWLIRRIAWRLQALAEGDLSERARRRAAELANDADLRLSPPRAVSKPSEQTPTETRRRRYDQRLPPPGTVIVRHYKGATLQVRVLAHGLSYDGHVYPTLSAVAKAITGSHCNGYLFFRLIPKGAAS